MLRLKGSFRFIPSKYHQKIERFEEISRRKYFHSKADAQRLDLFPSQQTDRYCFPSQINIIKRKFLQYKKSFHTRLPCTYANGILLSSAVL